MQSSERLAAVFEAVPDPGRAGNLDDLIEQLRWLKVWAGDPSYEWITARVNAAWATDGRQAGELVGKTTVVDCFRPGRRRLNPELVVAVVRVLHPDVGYVAHWRQALQVVGGLARAAAQVRVQEGLPPDPDGFTGRTVELACLLRALDAGRVDGEVVVVSAIAGMAGVGKTQLAIRAGHLYAARARLDRVLFVNLRGFHPDPGQPPADPAAVLEGFLRVLGVPGRRIPHDLAGLTAAYRRRLAGSRTLVVLDNAADTDQVQALLPETPGCPVLVTSRRRLSGLDAATHVTVDVFSPADASAFLARAAAGVPRGADRQAADRIAGRCGHLPLALGVVAAHIRGTPGWTLTDHADRLDERLQQGRLEGGVELALDVSYRQLPDGRRRLLRLLALHPGQDFDVYAAAALADRDLPAASAELDQLCRDHLSYEAAPGRYTFHDLVRAYATGRGSDEDSPSDRRAALTRLFDYYLATTAAAMDVLHPAETQRRPRIPSAGTPAPTLTDTALAWLDTERPNLVVVAAHTADHGWPTHATRLSAILHRYLGGGHYNDALTVHGHAVHAGRQAGDQNGQAQALANLGGVHAQLGRYEPAAESLRQALDLFQRTGDPLGQARTLNNLGLIAAGLGRSRWAAEHYEQARILYRQAGDRTGEARALNNLGNIEERLGRFRPAVEHQEQALILSQEAGDRISEATVLNDLGGIEVKLGKHGPAAARYEQALILFRQAGSRTGEAWVLDSLGTLHTRLGRPAQATECHKQALAIYHETGNREGEAWALNGLGEAVHATGQPADALTYHADALAIASDIGARPQEARARTGLGHAHHALDDQAGARHHYEHALNLYTDVGSPQSDQIRTYLAAVSEPTSDRADG
ncbi:tetratricopeptide repeat protein [Flindersiella endophytica]